jgi:hypothetical protein
MPERPRPGVPSTGQQQEPLHRYTPEQLDEMERRLKQLRRQQQHQEEQQQQPRRRRQPEREREQQPRDDDSKNMSMT